MASAGAEKGGVFRKDNLIAWCVVPFDARQRGPAERAAMLQRLGITMLAYDWRDKDIPTWDQEADELARRGIKFQGFWMSSGLEPEKDKRIRLILDFLKRRRIRTQLWYWPAAPKDFESVPADKKVEAVARAVGWLASQAREIGCSVGMYNHGGWTGEPENQLAVIKRLKMPNVGIVYNFHHGHEQMDRFAQFFPALAPHLMAVNLNGMRKGGPMILTIGEGDRELEMLRIIRKSKYRGPVGILNHRTDVDAEEGLARNIEGLRNLLRQMGDNVALETYR